MPLNKLLTDNARQLGVVAGTLNQAAKHCTAAAAIVFRILTQLASNPAAVLALVDDGRQLRRHELGRLIAAVAGVRSTGKVQPLDVRLQEEGMDWLLPAARQAALLQQADGAKHAAASDTSADEALRLLVCARPGAQSGPPPVLVGQGAVGAGRLLRYTATQLHTVACNHLTHRLTTVLYHLLRSAPVRLMQPPWRQLFPPSSDLAEKAASKWQVKQLRQACHAAAACLRDRATQGGSLQAGDGDEGPNPQKCPAELWEFVEAWAVRELEAYVRAAGLHTGTGDEEGGEEGGEDGDEEGDEEGGGRTSDLLGWLALMAQLMQLRDSLRSQGCPCFVMPHHATLPQWAGGLCPVRIDAKGMAALIGGGSTAAMAGDAVERCRRLCGARRHGVVVNPHARQAQHSRRRA